MKKQALMIYCLAIGGLTVSASADLIVGYDLQNHSTSAATIPATVYSGDVTAGSVTAQGVSLLKNYGDGIYTANTWAQTSQPDPTKYLEWSMTAADGKAVAYDAIDISLVRGNWRSVHGAESWQLRASVDGFGQSDIALRTWDISDSAFDSIQTFLNQDISALGTQEGTVTFRLYGYDALGTSDYSGLAYAHPDLTGQGTNLNIYARVIPEPATLSVLALGGITLLRRRK